MGWLVISDWQLLLVTFILSTKVLHSKRNTRVSEELAVLLTLATPVHSQEPY